MLLETILHSNRHHTLVLVIEHLLSLLRDLIITIILILIDRTDACCRIYQRTTLQVIVAVVFVGQQTLTACLLRHSSFYQIASLIINAVNQIHALQFPVLIKMNDSILCHRVLSDHLLNKAI